MILCPYHLRIVDITTAYSGFRVTWGKSGSQVMWFGPVSLGKRNKIWHRQLQTRGLIALQERSLVFFENSGPHYCTCRARTHDLNSISEPNRQQQFLATTKITLRQASGHLTITNDVIVSQLGHVGSYFVRIYRFTLTTNLLDINRTAERKRLVHVTCYGDQIKTPISGIMCHRQRI